MSHIDNDSRKTWRLFMINISLIIILFLSGIFLGFVLTTNRIIKDQMYSTARSHFRNIVLTRRWNADHGGVYVEKRAGVVSNPYLENPDITTVDGKVYTKKNPALMTREISEYAREAGDFIYHITSLNPLNPDNRPDDFEKNALEMFEGGSREFTEKKQVGGKTIFRYMAPLYVEKACLSCHGKQMYKIGDVRGGISVTFDISNIQKDLKINKILIGVASLITVSILIAIFYFMVSRVARKLRSAHRTIELMAITDDLTRLYNRRYFYTCLGRELTRAQRYGRSISLLMLDIDHFKRVNDNYGHKAGDLVLRGVADMVKVINRKTDVVARYGGEEFTVILPEADIGAAVECAEKIRQEVEAYIFRVQNGQVLQVTVSIGVSSINFFDKKMQIPVGEQMENYSADIVEMVDQALYEAKESGRNRVVVKES
ncbi:MAG: diguanylate cyclase [Desulfobacterales bacterium]|nr:diguanylate cyclase [Desulfobacterales bacterium]